MATIKRDITNTIFNIAADLVNQSSRNIFLTGKAGTGKTTFLRYIRESCPKQMAIVAPTGVAAINAGGVTIHSFFQLPFTPFIPESKGFDKNNDIADKHSLLSRLRLTGEKKKIIQELELLIIDEISMVRCDTLDAIDAVMRHIRQRRFERFGGVQVLFIGDMYQLPPVVPEQEWRVLSEFYNSPYFFDSRVIQEEPPVYIEFTRIYRQSEERFINLLNQVRNNTMDETGLGILDSRFKPVFRRTKDDGYIVLTTHNKKADSINAEELQKINEKMFAFDARIEGEFSEKAYPADDRLLVKTGAQVMFIKNDLEKTKRFFNGKIGVVTRIEEEKIYVQCKDEAEEVAVDRETWENIRYSLDKTTRKVDEEVLGSFTQYPLRLAWAITIHKSQGLTFEKAIIDAGEAFAPGQVYVALSRCTSLEGMVLQTRIRPSSLHSDNRIVAFSKSRSSSDHLQSELVAARKSYQLSVLLSVFDFTVILANASSSNEHIQEHQSSFNPGTPEWLRELQQRISGLQEIALKFQSQLKSLAIKEDDEGVLQERVSAASGFFSTKLEDSIAWLLKSPAVTDSRIHAKEYNEGLKEIFVQLSIKKYLVQGLESGFDLERYQQLKKNVVVPPFTVNSYAVGAAQQRTESPHPVLYQQLRKLRDSICAKKDMPVFMVATGKTLDEMTQYLPHTLKELEKISGFGKAKSESYGQQFLDIILDYSDQHGLSSLVHQKTTDSARKESSNSSRRGKPDTKTVSFELYKEGKSIEEIAKERSLTIQTIEGHLAHYIREGQINVEELISREKLVIIEPVVKELNGGSLTAIKEKVGDSIGFGDIRLAIAWYDFKRNQE